MNESRLRFTLTRKVQAPKRASNNESGIDFFIPEDLTFDDIKKANANVEHTAKFFTELDNDGKFVSKITIYPHSRIIIPSGVKALIEPNNSALIAANKSGVSTKKGLIFGAQVVDSTYIGEIHISLINTTDYHKTIRAGDKSIQFIHTPIFLTEPELISLESYNDISLDWSTRGSNWQGSTDNK